MARYITADPYPIPTTAICGPRTPASSSSACRLTSAAGAALERVAVPEERPRVPPSLEAYGITKRFGTLTVPDGAGLRLAPGDFHALDAGTIRPRGRTSLPSASPKPSVLIDSLDCFSQRFAIARKPSAVAPNAGLCESCRHQRLVRNTRGSSFLLCERSRTDPAFPRYPRLPVTSCAGYEPSSGDSREGTP